MSDKLSKFKELVPTNAEVNEKVKRGVKQAKQILGDYAEGIKVATTETVNNGSLLPKEKKPKSFKKGGHVNKTGVYKLHKDEVVLNKEQRKQIRDLL